LDLDEINYNAMICGVDKFVLTKSDVLNNFEEVKIYCDGKYLPLAGWKDVNSDEFERFVNMIESYTNTSVSIVSFGAGRNDILEREYIV
jgi:adenylosuccinate synthase